jgi:hypothetical protein
MIAKYKNIIKFLLGILCITLIFWNRFLRARLPLEYSKINVEHLNVYILSSIFFTVIFTFLFFYTVIKIISVFKQSKASFFTKNFYYLQVQEFLKNYVIDAPQYVYDMLTKNINLAKIIEYPASLFVAHFAYPRCYVIIFYYLPQVLVSSIFFIEVYFFHQRVIFIKILSLLVILLLAKLIIFIFKNYSDRRLKHYDLFFDIITQEDGVKHVYLKPPHLLPKHIPLEEIVNKYNTMYLYWIIYSNIYNFTLEIDTFNLKYKPYINVFTFFFFTLGWFYVSFFLLKYKAEYSG